MQLSWIQILFRDGFAFIDVILLQGNYLGMQIYDDERNNQRTISDDHASRNSNVPCG